ncbi:MAG: DUF4276 family protein [Planctomycetota bacterium]
MSKKSLVLFVEGDGDCLAIPILIKRLLTEYNAWDTIKLDPYPFKTGGVSKFFAIKNALKQSNWERWLQAACKRQNIGGVLVVIDGDASQFQGKTFCAADVARELSARATRVGAGKFFSVAVVFAMQEYETWLMGGIQSLSGVKLPNNRSGVRSNAAIPQGDIESAPRDAKGWLSGQMETGARAKRNSRRCKIWKSRGHSTLIGLYNPNYIVALIRNKELPLNSY